MESGFVEKWYFEDNLHRKVGPAVEFIDGEKHWYVNGKRHRENGPAVEGVAYFKAWWLNNKLYGYDNDFTIKSWKKFVKTLIFY